MMRRICIVIVAVLSLCAVVAVAAAQDDRELLEQLASQPAPPFVVPSMEFVTLTNGMRCIFVEDPLLPIIRMDIVAPYGTIHDPNDAVGLSSVVGSLVRSGGFGGRSPEEVDRFLDETAINVGVKVSTQTTRVQMHTLSENRDAAMQAVFDMMYDPGFDEARFALDIELRQEGVRKQNDEPAKIASRIIGKMLYGENNPWVRTSTVSQLESITLESARAWHATWFAPQDLRCTVVGDFRTTEMQGLIEQSMARFAMPKSVVREAPAAPVPNTSGQWFISKPTPQANIYIGQRSIDRYNGDKYALFIADQIYGGSGFGSWLKQQIRGDAGLAYETWSSLSFGPREAVGRLIAHAKTQSPQVQETLRLMYALYTDMSLGKNITADKVAEMKRVFLQKTIFEYEDPYSSALSALYYDLYDLPMNYGAVFAQRLEQVTVDDVVRVAKKYYDPKALTTLVVGDPDVVKPQLKQFGPVRDYELGEY